MNEEVLNLPECAYESERTCPNPVAFKNKTYWKCVGRASCSHYVNSKVFDKLISDPKRNKELPVEEAQEPEMAEDPETADAEDRVNHPNHYCRGGIECIKGIEASMPAEEFQGYCKGNVLKYVWRFREKAGLEDLKKARVYLNWLIESVEKGQIS